MIELHGERVTLRPLRPDEFEVVGNAIDVALPGWEEFLRERLRRSGHLVDGWLDLAIEVDGVLVGDIGARSPRGAFPTGVFEIGVAIFDDRDRHKGIGREAVALFVGHLFAAHGAGRVQATTDVTNAAMRRVLEALGFVHEGTLRAFMPGPDGREDYAMYAVTREEWARSQRAPPA